MVRAKFKVVRLEKLPEAYTVVLQPVYDPDPNSENGKFWKYTPFGEVKLGTINESAAKYFEEGGEYYLDFTKA